MGMEKIVSLHDVPTLMVFYFDEVLGDGAGEAGEAGHMLYSRDNGTVTSY